MQNTFYFPSVSRGASGQREKTFSGSRRTSPRCTGGRNDCACNLPQLPPVIASVGEFLEEELALHPDVAELVIRADVPVRLGRHNGFCQVFAVHTVGGRERIAVERLPERLVADAVVSAIDGQRQV